MCSSNRKQKMGKLFCVQSCYQSTDCLAQVVFQIMSFRKWLGSDHQSGTNQDPTGTHNDTPDDAETISSVQFTNTPVFEADESADDRTLGRRFYPEIGIFELADGRMSTILTLESNEGTVESVGQWQQLCENLGCFFAETAIEFDFQLYVSKSELSKAELDETISQTETLAQSPILQAYREAADTSQQALLTSSTLDATRLALVIEIGPEELDTPAQQLPESEINRQHELIDTLQSRRTQLKTACESFLDQYNSQLASVADWLAFREKAWRWELLTGRATDWERTVPGPFMQTLVSADEPAVIDDVALAVLFETPACECDISICYESVHSSEQREQPDDTLLSVTVYGETERELTDQLIAIRETFRQHAGVDMKNALQLA